MGVNPKCIDDYAVLEWKNLTKLHIFAAKHKVNTYSEKTISLRWLYINLELTPSEVMTSRETQEYLRSTKESAKVRLRLLYTMFDYVFYIFTYEVYIVHFMFTIMVWGKGIEERQVT